MRYPIGIQTFETIIKENCVYVDKTDLVYDLAQKHICFLSRPRRFGKSLLLSTLDSYFSGRRELFKGLKIQALEKDWDTYPVFRIDFAKGRIDTENGLEQVLEEYIASWESLYGKNDIYRTLSSRFQYVLEEAAKKTGRKAVVLIDEYDKPLLDVLGRKLVKTNGKILKDFYGTFKAADESLRFVFLTGVTKLSQNTVFASCNQIDDISSDIRYDAICGFTEQELEEVFGQAIDEMAGELGFSVAETKSMLKKLYNGYHFSKVFLDIYNPFSIINAFDKMSPDNYWYMFGSPKYLARLLEAHHINMQELTSKSYGSQCFIDYRDDGENPLAMLYQSGYLTIKGYDRQYDEYALDYPNVEVGGSFLKLVASSYLKKPEALISSWAINLDKMLCRGDLDMAKETLTEFFSSAVYEEGVDSRAKDIRTHYQYMLYLVFRLIASYSKVIEKQNSNGRADIIVETGNDIYIFAFRLEGNAEAALKDIEERQYALPYILDKRRLHKVGAVFSNAAGTIEDWMAAD